MIAIADTSFVLAVGNKNDAQHKICVEVFQQQQIVYLPQSTLAEIAYMLGRSGGNLEVAGFLLRLSKTKYRVLPLAPEDLYRTAEILQQYADSRVDFVDATIVTVAERLKITRSLTLDRRDFGLVHPRHSAYFEILP
jgi:predicted nucleic acid-binding protein